MSECLLIQHGRILDPAGGRDERGDLYVRDGKIAASLSDAELRRAKVVSAEGKVVCPGLVDIHVHFREPGQTHKETIRTGSRAAAAGGFTTVVCMPNTSPPCDNTGTIQYVNDVIERDALIEVLPTGTITVGMKGKKLAPIGSLFRAGVAAITDDGKCVQNNEIMRRAVEYAHMFGLTVMDHCQDESLTRDAAINEGTWSMRLGLRGWPNSAEDVIVSRNVILSNYSGAHIHMQHISSSSSVDIIRRAKLREINVTAEASPHHLHLIDEHCKTYNTHFKMNPPLRSEKDRQGLIEGLKDGTIDCIATDHAPHTNHEKDVEFDYAPFGIIGLETALAVTLEALYHAGHLSLPKIIHLMTTKPADLLRLNKGRLRIGDDADIAILDPDEPWKVDPANFQSQSSNCPWNGMTLRGRVKTTISKGRVVYDGSRIIEPQGEAQ